MSLSQEIKDLKTVWLQLYINYLMEHLHTSIDGMTEFNWYRLSPVSPSIPLIVPLTTILFFIQFLFSFVLLSMCCSCCYCQFTIFNYILGKFLKQLILYWWLFEYKGKWIKKKISWYLKALSYFISRLFPLEKMAKKSDLECTTFIS